MGYSIVNMKGKSFDCSNSFWPAILSTARDYGWTPAGTVLYKRSEIHPDQEVLSPEDLPEGSVIASSGDIKVIIAETEGDLALTFHQATKSEEIETEWDGGYCSSDFQVIQAEDAKNMAKALSISLMVGEWGENRDYIQELIDILQDSECMIT